MDTDMEPSEMHVGYSVFDTFEDCYQYNENACFIGDTREAAEAFLQGTGAGPDECRIDAITFGDIIKDYGGSYGEYAMEQEAFLRFKQVAERNGIRFSAELFDEDDTLQVVTILGN